MSHALLWNDLDIQAQIGAGHSGTVVRAVLRRPTAGLGAGEAVAVKRYKSWVLDEPGQMERIFRELDVGRRIQHPNLVRVLGVIADSEGRPALVMKLYEGETLEAMLARHRADDPIPIDSAFTITRCLADVIRTLHENGIVHRDVKPANIIMAGPLEPILGDFGVVRSDAFPEQTTTGGFLGTIRYAAPEYLFGKAYTATIDVYALGALVYEMFTNKQTFGRQQHWAMLVAAVAGRPFPVSHTELRDITTRASRNAARFVQFILEHSRCAAEHRNLQLSSLIEAVDARLWEKEFSTTGGSIGPGEKVFHDRFGSACAAAAAAAPLRGEDLDVLHDLLDLYFWPGRVSRLAIPSDLLADLVQLGVVDSARKAGEPQYATFAPSVLEAFALGLL